MRIDLTCPVELWHFRMPTAESPFCTVQLYNLSEKTVVSIQACYLCYDQDGEQTARHVERVQGLEAPTRCAFEMSVRVDEGIDASGMELLIEKVWFEDGTIWRRGTTHMTEYALPAPPDAKRLAILRELAGADASVCPSDQGAVWICVCGRPNPAGIEVCSRCLRSKHAIFTNYNESNIEKIYSEREAAAEDEARAAQVEKARLEAENKAADEKKRKRRKHVLVTVLCLLLAAAIGCGGYFYLLPWYRYTVAERELNNQNYASARQSFVELGDYSNAAEMVKECDYREAQAALAGDTYTSLRAAQDSFDALADYKDSAELAREARYKQGQKRALTDAARAWACSSPMNRPTASPRWWARSPRWANS